MRRTSWVKTRHSLHPEVAIWPLPNANRRVGSGPFTPLRDAGAPASPTCPRPRKPHKACKRERERGREGGEREVEREREREKDAGRGAGQCIV